MHSIGYVVLPEKLEIAEDAVCDFVKSQIAKYCSELQVEPYQRFFTKKETMRYAKHHGFCDLEKYGLWLQKNHPSYFIENGLLYEFSTNNSFGKFDYYIVLFEETAKGVSLADREPFQVVTPDGEWRSAFDYGYKPLLDFKIAGLHPDNELPDKRWKEYLKTILKDYGDRMFAVLDVHM